LPSLAGVWPKNQFSFSKAKTKAKEIRKDFVIFKK
jgi:hypothetical protein